jgi:hypothetical protein
MNYLIYDTTTGRIVRTGSSQDPLIQEVDAGQDILVEEADQRTEYVDLNTLTMDPKAAASFSVDKVAVLANTVDEVQLQGLDEGDEVTVRYEGRIIDYFTYGPGDDALTFEYAGEYTVQVRPLYKLENEVIIDAT